MKILAIESSCDETAAAVVEDGTNVLSSEVASQIKEHRSYGGVVPEIASRRHCENICAVVGGALIKSGLTMDDIDALAVTYAPGLIGALLVGVNYVKGIALAAKKPIIPVHHLRAHVAANYISSPELKPPFLCLIISGGHSHIAQVNSYTDFTIIGRTHDDAAGEAYDKSARALGFPYPGGIYMDKAAQQGDQTVYKLPRPKVDGHPYDFSFSGLKTAVLNTINNANQKGEEVNPNNMAAAFQLAVCDLLADKTMLASKDFGFNKIVLAGGVSANSGVRARFEQECRHRGYQLFVPPLWLCGDNAAMVGAQAYYEFLEGHTAGMNLNAVASLPIDVNYE